MKLVVFGDSIAAAAGASSPANGFASKLAAALGATLVNNGVSTAMAIDQGTQLFNTVLAADDIPADDFGTNDQAKYDTDPAKRACWVNCIRAFMVRGASGATNATPANGVSFSGAWNNGYAYGTYGATAAGAKATFSISGESVALGFLQQFNNSSTFRVRIDGIDKGVFAIGGDVRTLLGSAFGPMCLAFGDLGSGVHSVEVETLSASPTSVAFFQWFSAMTPRNKYLTFNIPHAVNYTYGGSDANVDAYNAAKLALRDELTGMGLDIVLADVCSVLTSANMADDVHPNNSGHQIYADKGLAAIQGQQPEPGLTYTPTTVYAGSDGAAYVDIGGKKLKILIAP